MRKLALPDLAPIFSHRLWRRPERIKQLLLSSLASLANRDSMRAVREGLLWVVPCLIVSAFFLILASLAEATDSPQSLQEAFRKAHEGMNAILPLLIAASIGYMIAIPYRLPRLPAAFLSFAYVGIATSLLHEHPRAAASLVLFIAIASPLLTVPLMARLYRMRWTNIVQSEVVGANLRDALNLIVPGLLIAIGLSLVLLSLLNLTSLLDLTALSMPLPLAEHPYQSGMLITGANSLLWFFGVHGYYTLQPIFSALDTAVNLNALASATQDGQPHPLNLSLLSAFVFIGGSGGTLSLIVAILLSCEDKALRLIAWSSVPIALLNVNEILLFGLPIILNPRLVIPFVVVPMVNVVVALLAVELGWLAQSVIAVPLTSPVLMNAYLATNGDLFAPILQLLLIGLGTLIYLPFTRAMAQRNGHRSIQVRSLDTTFTRLQEEGALYQNDLVTQGLHARKQAIEQNAKIREISEYDFYLEYQPQVSTTSGLVTGCEALLRARDSDGRSQPPWAFLEWLERAKLMTDLDLWVARTALDQVQSWKAHGFRSKVTINVTGHTLTQPDALDRLLDLLAQADGLISVEVTEQSMVGQSDAMQNAISKLHSIGAKVYIDDFGTGYSALSYLHQFEVDAIKVDRSFVLAQDTERGRQVIQGVLRFADTLNLSVVVEGVETETQLNQIRDGRERTIQGWYYSRSLSGQQFPEFVRARTLLSSPQAACGT